MSGDVLCPRIDYVQEVSRVAITGVGSNGALLRKGLATEPGNDVGKGFEGEALGPSVGVIRALQNRTRD